MNTETIKQISAVFQPVAEKIGQGAQYGWEVVLKQQYVYGIENLVAAISGIILAIITTNLVIKSIKKANGDPDSPWFACAVGGGLLGAIIIISMIGIGTTQAIGHLINPAYYALDFFIQLAK